MLYDQDSDFMVCRKIHSYTFMLQKSFIFKINGARASKEMETRRQHVCKSNELATQLIPLHLHEKILLIRNQFN